MDSAVFPDRRDCYEELRRDPLYGKIPEDMRLFICGQAWETGVKAAASVCRQMEAEGMETIHLLIESKGLVIQRVNEDRVAGNLRFFGEYVEKQKKIILYGMSLCRLAERYHISCSQAEELVLAHEYFHFLECTSLGSTSGQYMVPWLKVGRLCLGKSRIRSLSEIGAHGFSHTYRRLRGESVGQEDKCDSDREKKGQVFL